MRRWSWSIVLLVASLFPTVAHGKPSKTSHLAFASLRFPQSVIDDDDRLKVWRRLVELIDHRAGLGAGKGLKYSLELPDREVFARKTKVRYVVGVTVESVEPAVGKGWSATLWLFDAQHASEGSQALKASCEQCDLTTFILNELPALAEELDRAMRGVATE